MGNFNAITCTEKKSNPTLTEQRFKAVLDTECFAQLYAAGTLSFESDAESEKKLFPIDMLVHPGTWRSRYMRVLPIVAWTTSVVSWNPFSNGQQHLKLADIITHTLQTNTAIKEEIAAFTKFLDVYAGTLKRNPTKIDRFGTFTRTSSRAELAVSQASLNDHKAVSVRSTLVSITTHDVIGPVFSATFDTSKATIHVGQVEKTLDLALYEKKRDWITEGINGHKDLIIGLP
ncbi:MAG: hypothetical protein GEV11_00380 [Streptosporangiales bacterium]|nr:hypothetical protein [Streptosporangiales bacterium]